MPLGFELSTEGLDGGIGTPLLEPPLDAASFTVFTAFLARHQCPPWRLSWGAPALDVDWGSSRSRWWCG
jgi:hypothetical protein